SYNLFGTLPRRNIMEYWISESKDHILVKATGMLDRHAIYSVGTFIRPLLKGGSPRIVLDIDGLEEEREMIFHVGLINAFKREIEQAGGSLTVLANRPHIVNFLRSTGLDRI